MALLFFLLRLSLDQDECLLGTHDCSPRQFCANTLGSFYCVSHTVLCAEGFILNMHRKCVGKREPLPAPPSWLSALLHAMPPRRGHMLKGLPFAYELSAPPLHVMPYVSWCPVPLLHRRHREAAFPRDPCARRVRKQIDVYVAGWLK